MDLRLLQTFQVVIERGSLNSAAVELGYAQSTVTQHIQQLEQQLGLELFHRSGKRLKISDAGKLLQEHAQTLLRHANEIQRSLDQFAAGNGGSVRIGAVEPFVNTHVPPLLREFMREPHCMDVQIEVAVADTLYDELDEGKLDIVIGPYPNGRRGLRFQPLFFEPLGFLIPRSHRLSRKKDIDLGEILQEPLILSGQPCAFRLAFEQVAPSVTANATGCITITSVDARKAAAQAGLGIALIPLSSARPVPPGTVLRTPMGKGVGVKIGVACRTDAYLSPAAIRFERLVNERINDIFQSYLD